MFKKLCLLSFATCCLGVRLPAQTTNGLITGTITDSSEAVILQAQVAVTNKDTGASRTAKSDNSGLYIVQQLPPGIYDVSITKAGFATQTRPNVQLQVNQSVTLNFQLTLSSVTETVEVTAAPPPLNTTSATLGHVVSHDATVNLPLNGREFTQLALLAPGAAPIQDAQQTGFAVVQGQGGISPSVNGQRGEQNNFTMDGLLNNQLFMNTWAISPPPDALQEFNVQSHITDAQFAISSGANINVVTRSGTNDFHGALWEFNRNAALAARNFFDHNRLPYNQNQYGVYFGGPVRLPHFNGHDNTWFSGYWEGFRAAQSLTYFGGTLTAAERTGDFSALLGPQVATDGLGRPEAKNQIYDPTTSRPDPNHPGAIIRDAFAGNIIPASRIDPTAPIIIQKFYPLPNLNVPAGVLPNLQFSGSTRVETDAVGIRLDHRFGNNDTWFVRYNRTNANRTTPEALPGYVHDLLNYAKTVASGYTHSFNSSTILSLHYGWSNMNLVTADQEAGTAYTSALHFTLNGDPLLGPGLSISNGYSGVAQINFPLGPQTASDFHADLSKVIGHHTLGIGGMFYRVAADAGAWNISVGFTQNATAVDATVGNTGWGPASLLLGLPDSVSGYTGNNNESITANWYAGYFQDQWKATKRLTITAGLRYDYVAPPQPNHAIAGLDFYTGTFVVTAPVAPLFPQATGRSTYYTPQYDGFEPRFGIAYQASDRTVVRAAFAMLDDHNNELVQQSQNIRLGWPAAASPHITLQNRGLPNLTMGNLPPESSFIDPLNPLIGQSAETNMRIPYSIEYNFGIERQLSGSMVLKLDYVGSVSRHQYLQVTANTARTPGQGSLASRGQPYTFYGGTPFTFETCVGNASYNAFQAELQKSLSSGLFFIASYTWSKSLDIESDPYGGSGVQNFYNWKADRGPSDYNLPHIFVFSGVYAIPVGKGKRFLTNPNRVANAVLGNWNVASIVSIHSGLAFECTAGGDIANVGGGSQRCNRVGDPYAGAGFQQGGTSWLNRAAFTTTTYTFGTEGRNDLIGPSYKNVDFTLYKDFPLTERARIQLRGEFFNLFNHTNFNNPTANIQSSSFGRIFGSYFAREIQLAAKVVF